jgi:hypothetical protein
VTVLALVLALSALNPAPKAHDRAFFRAIVAHDYAVPEGEKASALITELSGFLGSPDKELRDELAYSIPVRWIYKDKLLEKEELDRLLRAWSANLEVKVGETGTNSVLLRSFSALDLSILAALDLEKPFMGDEEFEGLLKRALDYLGKERDVRGYEGQVGWIHSAAHTADLLKFLARSPKLKVASQWEIAEAIEGKLAASGVFTHGEDERLARALLSLAKRRDFDPAALLVWCDRLEVAQKHLWEAQTFDHGAFLALENQKNALKALAVFLSAEKDLGSGGKEVLDRLLSLLARG